MNSPLSSSPLVNPPENSPWRIPPVEITLLWLTLTLTLQEFSGGNSRERIARGNSPGGIYQGDLSGQQRLDAHLLIQIQNIIYN